MFRRRLKQTAITNLILSLSNACSVFKICCMEVHRYEIHNLLSFQATVTNFFQEILVQHF